MPPKDLVSQIYKNSYYSTIKDNPNQIKWVKDANRHSSKDIQMSTVKRCSVSFIRKDTLSHPLG